MSETESVQPVVETAARKCWGYPWWMLGVLVVFAVCEGLFFYWGYDAKFWAIFGLFLMAGFGTMRFFRGLGKVILTFLILVYIGIFGMSSRGIVRELAHRHACRHHLEAIGTALGNYHERYGCFPPAFVKDEDGQPMHSWRMLLMQFLDSEDEHDRYNFQKPWNAKENQQLAESTQSSMWRCYTAYYFFKLPRDRTDYVAVVGDDTFWPADGTSRLMEDVTADLSNTAIVIETNGSDISWHEPRDLTVDDLVSGKFAWSESGLHPPNRSAFYCPANQRGRHILFADGSVRYTRSELSKEQLQRLFSITEPFDSDKELECDDPPEPRPIMFRIRIRRVWLMTLLMQLVYAYFPVRYKNGEIKDIRNRAEFNSGLRGGE